MMDIRVRTVDLGHIVVLFKEKRVRMEMTPISTAGGIIIHNVDFTLTSRLDAHHIYWISHNPGEAFTESRANRERKRP